MENNPNIMEQSIAELLGNLTLRAMHYQGFEYSDYRLTIRGRLVEFTFLVKKGYTYKDLLKKFRYSIIEHILTETGDEFELNEWLKVINNELKTWDTTSTSQLPSPMKRWTFFTNNLKSVRAALVNMWQRLFKRTTK